MLYLSSKYRNKVVGRHKINYDLCVSRLKTVIHSTVDSRLNFSETESLIFSFEVWTVSESKTKKTNCKGRIKMNFDRLTNISKELTVW